MFANTLVVAFALTQAPNPAVPKSEDPTAWACNVETLKTSANCLFEAAPTTSTDVKAQEKNNLKFAQELGPAACEHVATVPGESPDARLFKLCLTRFKMASDGCGLKGAEPIVDSKGRFVPAARSCYQALSRALTEATTVAAVSRSCCQCLDANGCGGGGRCYEQAASNGLSTGAGSCLQLHCHDDCNAVVTSLRSERTR